MHFFRMRLIIALIAGVTLVSVASTFFEVLAHKHMLRQDLERRTAQQAASLLPEVEQAFAGGPLSKLSSEGARLRTREADLLLRIYAMKSKVVGSAGPAAVFQELSQ